MADFHLEAKVVSRGAGRSAVAAAAYMSCSKILNDYDGVQHDFTRKQGLVWQQIFLPEYAPAEWKDRSVLWNAVEENEKTKDSRLAREFVAALPIELKKDEWIALLTEFIQRNFVSEGMCADVCIHDTDGHNPHAHIMLTVRPLDEKGKWQYKTEKEYLCVRDSEERGFTAAEFKAARADGWEKQYQYKVGKKKVYMTPSEAETHGYERVNKYPKSTKYGRQNPIAVRWNSEEQLVLWRETWANVVNRHLELGGAEVRIDHRSHADRGLDEQPTIHEGVVARALEKKGVVSDRCEINRQIRRDNAFLRELKAQMKKLAQTARNTVPALAEAMEALRGKLIIFRYQVLRSQSGKRRITNNLAILRPDYERYVGIVGKIKDKNTERKTLLAEKKATPVLQMRKHKELSARIAELTEELEELRSEKSRLLQSLDYAEDTSAEVIRKDISAMESMLENLSRQEQKYAAELDSALKEYAGLEEQGAEVDPDELMTQRLAIRTETEKDAASHVKSAYGDQYQPLVMSDAKRDVAKMLGEETERKSVREQLKEKRPEQKAPQSQKRRRDEWER